MTQTAPPATVYVPYGRRKFGVWYDIGSWVLHGGTSIVNVIYAIWLWKYLWQVKFFPWMPTIGAGPTQNGSSVEWVPYAVLAMLTAIILNLAIADFRNKPTAYLHIATAFMVLGTMVYAKIDYARGLLNLSGVQVHVMNVFLWTAVIAAITGLIALRLNRLYFGDVAGGANR